MLTRRQKNAHTFFTILPADLTRACPNASEVAHAASKMTRPRRSRQLPVLEIHRKIARVFARQFGELS
mgnify:CR=1 FL=1